MEEYTGISKGRVKELAEIIHKGKNVSFWWTMGVNQGYQAVRTAQGIINLALMTGNIGRPGTGANSLTGQCNAMGSRAFSNTAGLFGGGDFDNPVRRKRVAEVLGVDESVLAQKPTAPYNVIVEKIISGEIKALWVVCTNPRHSWTNNKTFMKEILQNEKLSETITKILKNPENKAAKNAAFNKTITKMTGFGATLLAIGLLVPKLNIAITKAVHQNDNKAKQA